MNVKVTGLGLATLMACTFIQPVQAIQSPPVAVSAPEQAVQLAGVDELMRVISAEAAAARQAAVSVAHPQGIGLYLDSTPMLDVERELYRGVCYVTVTSFLAAVQPQAVVSAVDGGISVTSATLTQTPEGSVEESLQMWVYQGAGYVQANDRCLYLPYGVRLVNGSVALPLDTLAQIFNLELVQDEQTGYYKLYTQPGQAYLTWGSGYYNQEDLYWLSRIIYSESGNQPLAGKIAVGNVVMNRVASSKFPNTVTGVLFQKNQFSPAGSSALNRQPNWESEVAAKLVLEGAVVLDDALFFNRAGLDCYASRNRAYVATIGDHDFYA